MTNEECRAEALKRVQRSDGLFAEYQALPEAEKRVMYSEVSHLRQTAAVFAALAGPIDG